MTGELAVWHYRDWLAEGHKAMCGVELQQPVGVVHTCEDCLAALRKRREEAKNAT